MNQPNYKVTTAGQEPVTVPESSVAAFCIKRCGGGYTTQQTCKAMKMLNKIRQGESMKTASGMTIEIIPDE